MDPQAEFSSLAKPPQRPVSPSFRTTLVGLLVLLLILIGAMIGFGLAFVGFR